METATKVKEQPILFSSPMVRAILEGRKTQTRRVVKGMEECVLDGSYFDAYNHGPTWCWWTFDNKVCNGHATPKCPYGRVGDQLWVRETFSLVPCSAGCEKYPQGFDPKRSSASQPDAPCYGARYRATWDRSQGAAWKPSIHMPRWASRITLEITDIRVERLQEISEADAEAEGAFELPNEMKQDAARHACGQGNPCVGPIDYFAWLWDSINAKRGFGWDVNPWVWAIMFRRIEAA